MCAVWYLACRCDLPSIDVVDRTSETRRFYFDHRIDLSLSESKWLYWNVRIDKICERWRDDALGNGLRWAYFDGCHRIVGKITRFRNVPLLNDHVLSRICEDEWVVWRGPRCASVFFYDQQQKKKNSYVTVTFATSDSPAHMFTRTSAWRTTSFHHDVNHLFFLLLLSKSYDVIK